MGKWAVCVGRGCSFQDYDPSTSRGDLPHCSYTEQWVQFSPILNQRSVEQWPVWINYYSRYVEVSISKKNTADVAINSLEKMFATHGLPYTVTSDNGPHFVAESFQKFLKDNDIMHRKITPLWPRENGLMSAKTGRSSNECRLLKLREKIRRKLYWFV